ncbi:AT-rich interactive domain-containing protein 2 isoform X6 [Nymphalis io]|uniref:AT-rich interactive domain-containing protein 2 isoform X6 n=1 Tax=Inachis io TaxID=171585 RepID=UPI00216953E8|nr:AT-rich interactive domain-containing protein 2 isoform X6 [Nymphalis io]
MAKSQINTKSRDYLRDKEVFLKELKQFNESKNIPYKIPVVNGVDIDLYLLYSLVIQRGGLSKVNQNDTWESFLRQLRLPHPCVNGSTLLRRIYGTYLEKYERAKGPPGRDDDNDLDEDPRRGRGGGMPRISFGSGTYISASGEPLRTGNRVAGPSERLTLSLLSPMPNEQDFAVNVCTVLAADHSNRLPLSTTHHILDFLLAHAGVYNHSSLRDTIGRSYYEARGRYPHEFWQMRAGGGGAKELADETKFMQPGLEQPELMVQALAAHNTLTDCLMQDGEEEDSLEKIIEDDIHEDWVTEPSEEDQLFAPELTGGAGCVYTQRVLQIASIVRSLSFHEENVQYLARNTTLIRFLLLCANCWVGTLRQSGLDTLGNVSTELIIKDPATCLISRHVLSTIQSALVSQDRARVLAALELLNKLAQNEANEEALLKALESKVYSDVCALLSLRDIMVLVCTLECVYALTSLGDRACEAVARVPGLAHTLVALVTVEAQSYGPRACILMRVVETVSGPGALAAGDAERAHVAPQTPQNQPAKPSEPLQTSVSPAPAPAPPAPTPAPVPMSSLQQSHLQQRTVQENEHFAQAWLRATYEPLPGSDNSACDAAELYRQYLACCTKLSRKGVIAPAHFPRLVRTVFGGTVGPNTISNASGETQHVYIGIRAKNLPNRTNPPVGPSSPILKAQLTNKTAVVETKPPAVQTQTPAAPTHPQLSQALEGASNTSLIKHLLAHKVSPPAHAHAQVAQRQQSQQRVVPASTGTVVVQPNQTTNMEVDPEALIKCTTIIPGGVANNTGGQGEKMVLNAGEEVMVQKDEPVQIQIDDQLTIKSAQNKMLADLLEKKSNPPVQVVQMGQQMTAPTIQITETGQIVQVKAENNPLLQINSENTQPSAPFFQIKNEQGQLIQIKNDQGQIIQLKSDQLQGMIQFKNDQGQIVQIKNDGQSIAQMLQPSVIQAVKTDKDQIVETVVTDHSYTEPPTKKLKVEEKPENNSPQESVSKTAANLYAALAASALEDEDDLLPPKQDTSEVIQSSVLVAGSTDQSVIIQEPLLQVQQPTMQVQQPTIQVQQSTIQVQQPMQVQQPTLQMQASTIQVQQPTLQVQQPMLQVQPMDVQNIIASQSGQLILQEKPVTSQTTQFMQQPMQIIATPGTSQAGLSYIAQNISGNMMQKTIIIVQGPTGGGPLTLTNSGVIQSTQRVIVSQPALVSTSQPIAVVKTTITQNAPQITPSQQPIITTQPQPHKAQIVNQAQTQQIVVTQKQPPALISTSSGNPIVGTNQIIQGNQQLLQGNQQIIAVSSNQQIIMNTPMKQGVVQHRVVQQPQRSQITTVAISNNQTSTTMSESKTVPIQSGAKSQQPIIRQVITRQPIMMGNTKIGDKEVLVTQPVAEKQPVPKKTVTPPPQPLPPGAEDTPWICHWRGCGKSFGGAGAVFAHAARAHCPAGAGGEAPCQWLDCDRVPRRTFALLNHLTDKHCTPQALKAIYNSRRHTIAESEASKPVSLGYPPNAALAALNKHSTDMFNPRELMDENEGPVTKSIRLTAALILRNIVIYSNTGRRLLRSYEAHLASIALSNVEASRTIAQVLYDMNNI